MFHFTIRELLGLIAVEAVTAAAGKKVLAADSGEEVVVVFGIMIAAAVGYSAIVAIVRLAMARTGP